MSETDESNNKVTVKTEPKEFEEFYIKKEADSDTEGMVNDGTEESAELDEFEWKFSCVETEIKEENTPLQLNSTVKSPEKGLPEVDGQDSLKTEETKFTEPILKDASCQDHMKSSNESSAPETEFPLLECDQRLERVNYDYFSRPVKSRVKKDRIFSCDICNKSFTRKDSLNGHIRTHGTHRPYLCTVCNKSFPAKNRLTQHLRSHTDDRPFTCQVCGKSFALKGDHNRHLNVHTGYRPFSCELCNKCFPEKSSLKRHMLTHTGDRPFPCELCNQAFSVRISLTKHIRTHTGDRPYSCHLCNKTFTRKDSLNRHLIKMHDENAVN